MNRWTPLSRLRAWRSSRSNVSRPPSFRRLLLEPLEDRRLLSLTTWTIDPSLSFLSLAIADQAVNYDGTNMTVRVRNQSGGNSGPWNTGNSAAIAGTISTDYVDGQSIEFLTGQTNIVGINSGDYRPNPSDFDPNATDAENPNGSFTGTSTAPAVFGGRVRASLVVGLEITVDAALFSFYDTHFELASGVLPITSNDFASNSLTIGISSSGLGMDGLNVAIVGQLVSDTLTTVTGMTSLNSAPTGTITDLGGQNRRLTIPCALEFNIPIDDDPAHDLHATGTGQVVASAVVDLPATNVWHNDATPCDVDGLNGVEPLDVLTLINYINIHPGDASLPTDPAGGPPYWDVNDDNQITAKDVLAVVDYLNSDPSGEGEAGMRAWAALAVSVPDPGGSLGSAGPVEAGPGRMDPSRWQHRPWDATLRGRDAATGRLAAPDDWARGVCAVADAMADAGHSAGPRFSADVDRGRTGAQRRISSQDRNFVARTCELESILTEIGEMRQR